MAYNRGYLKRMSFLKSRSRESRSTDYRGLATNIVDSYPKGFVHGVQKDATQNGWDAAVKHTRAHISQNWGFEFVLSMDNEEEYLLQMIDRGTSGLTGRQTAGASSDDLPADERWARWESLAFGKQEGSLGARGQGKMVFMYASQKWQMSYDSLREDGSYRYGWTSAEKNDSPIDRLDESEARREIELRTGLKPLTETGTRVIIHSPREELVEAIKSGLFLQHIEETWWPNIFNFGAKIRIKDQTVIWSKPQEAKTPEIFQNLLSQAEDKGGSKFWRKHNTKIKFKGQLYTIKRIELAHNKSLDLTKTRHEHLQGIAYFRSGMKIGEINVSPRQFRQNVYGYVEFEKKLDNQLAKIENSTHYGFRVSGSGTTLWKKIKETVESEMDSFSKEKLGVGVNAARHASHRRRYVEREALQAINEYSRRWNVSSGSKHQGFIERIRTQGAGRPSDRAFAISLHNFVFPDKGVSRLNWGESISNFKIRVINNTIDDRFVGLKGYLFHGDEPVLEVVDQTMVLKAQSNESLKGLQIHIDHSLSPGKYRLAIRLFDDDLKSKDELHALRRFIYVEEDPPRSMGSNFEFQELSFDEQFKAHVRREHLIDREWFLEEGSPRVLYYNTDHPSYKRALKTHDETRYLTIMGLWATLGLLWKDIKHRGPLDKRDCAPFEADELKDPRQEFEEIMRVISTIKKDIDAE